jgi:hypothetical protein
LVNVGLTGSSGTPQIANLFLAVDMRSFDPDGLTSTEHSRNAIDIGVVVARVATDPDQDLCQTELAKLRSSNHRLRAENLALRTRIERLKSNRSLEKRVIIVGMLSLWFFFLLSVMSKLIALSN